MCILTSNMLLPLLFTFTSVWANSALTKDVLLQKLSTILTLPSPRNSEAVMDLPRPQKGAIAIGSSSSGGQQVDRPASGSAHPPRPVSQP